MSPSTYSRNQNILRHQFTASLKNVRKVCHVLIQFWIFQAFRTWLKQQQIGKRVSTGSLSLNSTYLLWPSRGKLPEIILNLESLCSIHGCSIIYTQSNKQPLRTHHGYRSRVLKFQKALPVTACLKYEINKCFC